VIIDADLEQHGRTDKHDERQYDGGDGDGDPCTRAMNDNPCVTASVYTATIYLCTRVIVSKLVSNKCIAVRKVATPLRELTCHMGSHSVTCHLAEVTFPPLPQPKLVLETRVPVYTATTRVHGYTQGEGTSQCLWSRYDRHFVGITRRNALS